MGSSNGIEPKGNPTPQEWACSQTHHGGRGWNSVKLGGGSGATWREGGSGVEPKSPPLLPPPSTAPSKLEPGALKIAPEEQLPAGRPGDLLGSAG